MILKQQCIMSQPRAGWNTQQCSTRRAGQNIQSYNFRKV